ncbi:unnamed protein product [Clonostachys byssicola]|uniref:Zeta toxin domain-containing protein n=1 Tax=Clonostachys byssicola TaxID=160290 RepID=A0A9N9UMN1_9HYPO|nr:unnamed protein product [Clonostachys byssicola]
MPPPPDLSAYRLSPAESEAIFNSEIVPQDIAPLPPSPNPESPLAILAVGQTGAGKTRLCPALLSALAASNRKPAHLIADVYKTHHPSYSSINPSHLASAATGPDARIWLSMAVGDAARRRLDILLESACRHPSDFTSLAEMLSREGYRVVVVLLAVPAALSRLGILARFYGDLPEARSRGLPLRLTPVKVHDDSYEGLIQGAEWLDGNDVAEQVIVVRRGNLVAYAESRDGASKGGIAEAVRRERDRPLTEEEKRVALDDLETLDSLPEAARDTAAVKQLLKPLVGKDAGSETFSDLYLLEFSNSIDAKHYGHNILHI